MLRNKYKYAKNHGLLPSMTHKYHSPVISTALLGHNQGRQYDLCLHPQNPNMFIMFNDRQYLHKQCTHIIKADSQHVVDKIVAANPFKHKSLTVYIANNFRDCDRNIVGDRDSQRGLVWEAYRDLCRTKKQNSSIIVSIMGIQNENQLTDLLVIDKPQEYLPQHLKETPFLKRKIKVSKNSQTRKFYAQNSYIQTVQSAQDLRQSLQRYKAIKSQFQTSKFMDQENWTWMHGQLFQISEIQYDQEYRRITRTARTHYILKINQYLRSTGPLMLKLGMNIRKMQQRHSSITCDNNDSKILKLLSECFQKIRNKQAFNINIISQVGHYQTIKDEYQNLVPTSQLISLRADLRDDNIQNTSFLYLKHYHDYSSLVTLLSKVDQNQQFKNIQQYLQQSTNKDKVTLPAANHRKSYVCDTISSIQKKVIRNQVLIDQYSMAEQSVEDLQHFIKKTAKMYKQPEDGQNSRDNRTSFKKSENKTQHRMSLFQWGARQKASKHKIYRSKNEITSLDASENSRKSAEYFRGRNTNSKWSRSINNNLGTVYGIKAKSKRQVRSYTVTKHDKDTKGVVQELMKRQIIELGRQDEIYKDITEIQRDTIE